MKYVFYVVSLILTFSLALPHSNCIAQNHLKIFEEPGGGATNQQGADGTDNTFIYVAGGLIIAGILAYALLLKKDKNDETDTTKVSLIENEMMKNNFAENHIDEISRTKEKLPVDVFFGIRKNEAVLRGKTYVLGVSFKL